MSTEIDPQMDPQVKPRSLVSESISQIGSRIKIAGWLANVRKLGKLNFVLVKDRSGVVQVVVEAGAEFDKVKSLQPGSVLELEAEVQATANTELGVELINPIINVINAVTAGWPVEINKPELNVNIDTLLENRAITLRHPKQAAIFKVQGVMAQTYRQFMIDNGFTEYFGPAILASASEGGAELFRVDYMGKPAILAQSNQLYKQMMVGVYERVFAMQKCFRAENSNTRRHLTEIMQFEFEMGFIKDMSEVMEKIEAVTSHIVRQVAVKCGREIALLGVRLVQLPESGKYPRLKFTEALELVAKLTAEDTSKWDDLSTDSEKVLCEWSRQTHGSDFIFVTNYPKGKFYAYRDAVGVLQNFDLLCRDAEISSGGRRIDNYESLVASIKRDGLNPDDFSEYLSIFKYGMPPHGGFGLGMERFTMLMLGLDNIREATLFPSDTKRIASQTVATAKIFGQEAIKREVKLLFVNADVEFSVLKHEPTPTSEDAAKVRGLELSTGVKALILREKKSGKNVLINIPAHKKLDMGKVSAFFATQGQGAKFEFEKPDVINASTGLVVGGVPPFGHVFGIETYIDSSVFATETAAFNNADQRESLLCKSADLRKVLTAKEGNFCAE